MIWSAILQKRYHLQLGWLAEAHSHWNDEFEQADQFPSAPRLCRSCARELNRSAQHGSRLEPTLFQKMTCRLNVSCGSQTPTKRPARPISSAAYFWNWPESKS